MGDMLIKETISDELDIKGLRHIVQLYLHLKIQKIDFLEIEKYNNG